MVAVDALIKVIEARSGEVLFQCSPGEEVKAYEFARQMEDMGLAVRLESPSVCQGLAWSLGVQEEEWQEYQESLEQEIDGHQH